MHNELLMVDPATLEADFTPAGAEFAKRLGVTEPDELLGTMFIAVRVYDDIRTPQAAAVIDAWAREAGEEPFDPDTFSLDDAITGFAELTERGFLKYLPEERAYGATFPGDNTPPAYLIPLPTLEEIRAAVSG